MKKIVLFGILGGLLLGWIILSFNQPTRNNVEGYSWDKVKHEWENIGKSGIPYSERYIVTSTGRKAKITTEDGSFTIDKLEPGESVEIEYHMEFDKEASE